MKKAGRTTVLCALATVAGLWAAIPVYKPGWEWVNPKPTGEDLYEAHVFSSQKVLIDGCLASEDGGATWVTQGPFVGQFIGIWSPFFLDANNWWAGGQQGLTYKTTNGGKTWDTTKRGRTIFIILAVQASERSLPESEGWHAQNAEA